MGQKSDKVEHIDLISLVAANDVIFAMAEVNYTDSTRSNDKNNAVVAKHFETTGGSWGDEAFKEKGGNWNLELVTQKVEKTNNHAVIKSFAVAAKESKIYHITISNSTLVEKAQSDSTNEKWYVRVVEGTVNNGSVTGKEIKLESLKISGFSEAGSSEKLKTQPEELPPSDGFAFVTDENNIFFFMKGKTNSGNKNVVALFEFNVKDEGNKNVKLLPADISEKCYPSFFQWNKEIIMAPSTCPNKESHNVKVFNKKEKRFDDSNKPIARLRDFLKDKNNFTIAEVEGKNVLFCTQQKDVDSGTQKNVYLWMTDGTHVGKAGTIIEKIEGTFDGSVLYTKEELIALHQKYKTGSNGEKEKNTFSLTRLKEQLKKVKSYLDKWKKGNETVLALCNGVEQTNISCTVPPPTDGAVGFLRATTEGDHSANTIIWKDKYDYSDITPNKGENVNKVINGLKFGGAGKGAIWSMKSKQDEKPYNFIDFGFTLVATVEIGNKTNNKKNSILGVSLTPNTNSVGLWCTTDGKWGVSYGDDSTLNVNEKECKQGNTYNVALVLEKGNLDVYVNGEKLTNEIKTIVPSKSIEHFYFGANTGTQGSPADESHVTVTNVLLYNRPFNGTEIGNLKKYIKSVEVVIPLDGSTQEQPKNDTGSGSDQQTPPTLAASPTGEEKAPSPSRTGDGGVGGGVRVFSLLLVVLCVSAPLLHL